MRPGAPDKIAQGSGIKRRVRVSSWLGTSMLAESVPVSTVVLDDDGGDVPETLKLTVPARRAGRSWVPGEDPTHPLARFGQRLAVTAVTISPRGREFETPIGWFQIQSWSHDGGVVTVTAHGLLQVVADDKLPAATQPASGATFMSEARRLMTAGVPVAIDSALADRACPSSFDWTEDRLAALIDLADAWPARIAATADGVVRFLSPLGDTVTPVLQLVDGEGGVIIGAPRDDSRSGVYTACVASSSQDSSRSAPVSAEYVTTVGPYAVGTYGVVRRRYASPLLGTEAACLAAARTLVEDSQRQGRVQSISLPPDVRVERGDGVRFRWDGVWHTGWVLTVKSLALTLSGTPMVLEVGVAQ